jgi:channel protein (hemolysin III family)
VGSSPYVSILGAADPIAAGTHAVGALAAALAIGPLWRRSAGSSWRRLTAIVFALSMLLLFAASATYHLLPPGTAKRVLQRIDHGAIYLLIAGTYTPIVGNLATRRLRAVTLIAVWFVAICGIVFKAVLFGVAPDYLDVLLYLTMSWLGAIPFIPIVRKQSRDAVTWIVAAAFLYTAGAMFEVFEWPPLAGGVFGHHEAFHCAVLGAAYCFYRYVLEHALALPPSPAGVSS